MGPMTTTILDDRVWTRAERDALPAEERRYELLDGALIVSEAPHLTHQILMFGLYRQLAAACPPHLLTLGAPADVELAPDTVLSPDLLVARRDRLRDADSTPGGPGPPRLPGAPELAVEVLSISSRLIDRGLKKERYERAGTPSYWILDPDGPRLVAFELRRGDYEIVADVGPGVIWAPARPFSMRVTPGL